MFARVFCVVTGLLALFLASCTAKPSQTTPPTWPDISKLLRDDRPIDYYYCPWEYDVEGHTWRSTGTTKAGRPAVCRVRLMPGEQRHAALLPVISLAGLREVDLSKDMVPAPFGGGDELRFPDEPSSQVSILVQEQDEGSVRMAFMEAGYVLLEDPKGNRTCYCGLTNLFKVMFLCRPPELHGDSETPHP
jgi:hypothetical protein